MGLWGPLFQPGQCRSCPCASGRGCTEREPGRLALSLLTGCVPCLPTSAPRLPMATLTALWTARGPVMQHGGVRASTLAATEGPHRCTRRVAENSLERVLQGPVVQETNLFCLNYFAFYNNLEQNRRVGWKSVSCEGASLFLRFRNDNRASPRGTPTPERAQGQRAGCWGVTPGPKGSLDFHTLTWQVWPGLHGRTTTPCGN